MSRRRHDLVLGIDIGTRNCAIAIVQPHRGCARFINLDLLIDPDTGELMAMHEGGTYHIVNSLVDELEDYLQRAQRVGVEIQMKRRFVGIHIALICTINARFGNIAVPVSPVSVRAYFRIRGSDYEDRKNKSAALARRMLSPEDFRLCEATFNARGDGKNHVDVYEAFLIAQYIAANSHRHVFPPQLKRAKRQPRRPAPRLRVADIVFRTPSPPHTA